MSRGNLFSINEKLVVLLVLGMLAASTPSFVNAAPVITHAASADPPTLRWTTCRLSVEAQEDAQRDAKLNYTWNVVTAPPGAKPRFYENGNSSAKSQEVTFDAAGDYVLRATVTDVAGATASSSVKLTVARTPSLVVYHSRNALTPGAQEQLRAAVLDQFGATLPKIEGLTWSLDGEGTLTSSGLFTAPASPSTATVTASVAGMSKIIRIATVSSTSADLLANLYDSAMLDAPSAPAKVPAILEKLAQDGRFTDVDYAAAATNRKTGYVLAGARLQTLAQAYQWDGPKNAYYRDSSLRGRIIAAWTYLTQAPPGYRSTGHIGDRYVWVPYQYGLSLVLVRDILSKSLLTDALDKYFRDAGVWPIPTPPPSPQYGDFDGCNLAWQARGALIEGALRGDDERVANVVDRVTCDLFDDPLPAARHADLEPDGSFSAHAIYTPDGKAYPAIASLAYGVWYSDSLSKLLTWTRGTRFAFADPAADKALGLLLDNQQWLTYGKGVALAAMASSIGGPFDAVRTAQSLRDIARQYLAVGKRTDELKAWIERFDTGPTAANHLHGNHAYYVTDNIIHQRQKFMAAVQFISNRAGRPETKDYVNKLGYYEADGFVTFLSSGDEYSRFGEPTDTAIFPVWDWRRLPGTTVEQTSAVPFFYTGAWNPSVFAHSLGLSDFAGGVSDGVYGMAAMDYRRKDVSVTAKKAYMFFDDELVELGAGINAPHAVNPVYTSLDQSLLNGEVSIGNAQGTRQVVEMGSSLKVKCPGWINHHNTGYIILSDSAPLTVQVRNQTGDWSKIGATKRPATEKVFSAWLDHGVAPADQSYAFAIVAGQTPDATRAYADAVPFTVLSNTPAIQAVRHNTLKQTQIAFYSAGSLQVTPNLYLDVDQPILVLVKERVGGIEFTLADPTHALSEITVAFRQKPGGPVLQHTKVALPTGVHAGASVSISARMSE